MARYKYSDVEAGQGLFLTIKLKEQLLPGTFEYMLDDLIGSKIDISDFDTNYKNDVTGATAISPAVLIKLIIYAYLKGILSSRKIDEFAKTNIIAKALTGDMEPHWTTIAAFISSNSIRFREVFEEVLLYCNELDLIGGEMFAVDGLRLPSNASIEMSGTEEELKKKLDVYRRMAEKHIAKHSKEDGQAERGKETERRYQERQKQLHQKIENISNFLTTMKKKEGKHVEEIKSNVTDNESAMIFDSGTYIQGYIGIAVVDKENQIIVNAEAFGSANEGEHLPKILDKTLETLEKTGIEEPENRKRTFMADANYFSEDNFKACEDRGVEAIIPDSQYNRRLGENNERRFEAADFTYHAEGDCLICPNGKELPFKRIGTLGGYEGKSYQASVKDCRPCPLNARCIRTKKDISKWDRGRQIFITGSNEPNSLCGAMRQKLATE